MTSVRSRESDLYLYYFGHLALSCRFVSCLRLEGFRSKFLDELHYKNECLVAFQFLFIHRMKNLIYIAKHDRQQDRNRCSGYFT